MEAVQAPAREMQRFAQCARRCDSTGNAKTLVSLKQHPGKRKVVTQSRHPGGPAEPSKGPADIPGEAQLNSAFRHFHRAKWHGSVFRSAIVSSVSQVRVAETGAGPNLAPARHAFRFRPPYRQAIRRLTQGDPRLEDLALSFPALLFAIATGYGKPEAREAAIDLIDQGASLKLVARALGLPWWTRALPPEAFAEPLHSLVEGAEVQRRIANHIPADTAFIHVWLRAVLLANAIAGEAFALWLASRLKVRPRTGDRLVPLAAWAWYSARPETAGHALVRCPFEPGMSLKAALEEADAWRKRIDLAAALGPGIADAWYEECDHAGFRFVPLTRIEQYLGEAAAMDNCLDQFAPKMIRQATRVFSIRRDGRPIADIEIGPHEDDAGMPVIEQLRGPANRRVGAEVWQAAYGWLAKQPPRALTPTPVQARRFQALRREIWRPIGAAVPDGPAATALRDYLKTHDLGDFVR